MKLNNRGWGMFSFLILIGILFFLLILIAHMANEFDNEFPKSSRRQLEVINKA